MVGIFIIAGMILASSCTVLTPAQKEAAVRQAAFLAIPPEERAVKLSDEIENTLTAMVAARRVLRRHWEEYVDEDKQEFETLDLRSQALIPMAQTIADSSGLGQTMNLSRIIVRGERIYKDIDRLVQKNKEVYSPGDLVVLTGASADAQVFYDLAKTAHGAGQKVDTARAVLNVVKAAAGIVL
jgi:hypothetical protein